MFVGETFRNSMREILVKEFGANVEERRIGNYQTDLIIRDGKHILVEITSSTKSRDLENLLKAAEVYQEEQEVSPKLMIVTAFISPRPCRVAMENDIEIVSHE